MLALLPDSSSDLAVIGRDAIGILEELVERRDVLTDLADQLDGMGWHGQNPVSAPDGRHKHMAGVAARAAELVAELEDKNEAMERANQELARANVHAAELMGEIELKNREIQRLTVTDALTQTFNRRYLTDELPKHLKRVARYGGDISVIIVDVDHFKRVNDTYGHQVGDRVLVQFGRCLREGIRQDLDWVARYGGEEFVIVLPDTPSEGAFAAAERLRRAVECIAVETDKGLLHVTASFGVATAVRNQAGAVPGADDLVHVADNCLYQAKEGGRNRTVGDMAMPSDDVS